MSESLKKTLISRLQTSEKVLPREKTPIIGRLVPKLALVQDKSCLNFRKEKLEPLSPFLTKRLESTTERIVAEIKTERLSERISMEKTPLRQKFKLQPLHSHGDTRFWQGTSEGLLAFIRKVKENPEFHDDFWYFNKGENAYDLVLTSFNNKLPEYFTLSYRGISHFSNGEIQFVSLEDWERENYLFKKIQGIPFFSKYRVWKTFSIWMKQRRLNMIDQRKSFLRRNISYLNKDFQGIFLEIRQKCFIISKLDMLDLVLDHTKSLDQFKQDQKSKAHQKSKDLYSINDSIFFNLRSLCSSTTDKFIHSNITGSILDKEENLGSKVLPYTHEAVMRNHLQHLGKFIKLVDFMMLEAKLFLCENFYLKFFNFFRLSLRDLNRSGRAVFLIYSEFDGISVRTNPNVAEFTSAAWKAVKRVTKYVFNKKFFSDATDFGVYLKALHEFSSDIVPEAINPELILMKNEEIKENKGKIERLMEKYEKDIQDFIKSWKPFIQIYQNNSSLKVQKFRKSDIQNIFHHLEKFKKQMKDFQNLPENSIIGIFKFDLESIKSKLLPSPVECLSKLQSYLPELAMERANHLHSDLIKSNLKLFQVPSNIHEYISISEDIKHIEEHSEKIALKVMDLKDFIEMMEKHYISVPIDLKDKAAEISKTYEKMRTRMNFLYMRYETDKAKFIKMLRSETKNVEPRLEIIEKQLDNPIFVYKDSAARKMVELLTPISKSLKQLYRESEDFIRYQDILGIPRNNFESVGKVRKMFKILFSLWKAMDFWEVKTKLWADLLVFQVNLLEINRDLTRFHKIAMDSKVLEKQGNFLPDLFLEKIEKTEKLVKVIENLNCSSLKERHWKKIEEVVGFDLEKNFKIMTFLDAFNKDLHLYTEKTHQISFEASKEEQVENKFKDLIEPWLQAEFFLKFDKEKELFILQEPEKLQSLIEFSLEEIDAIVINPFITNIEPEVKDWELKLKSFHENFMLWLKCQNIWIELEKVLNFSDVSRNTLEKIKKFHHGFKEFTKFMFKNPSAFSICSVEGLTNKLYGWMEILNSIEKELEDDDIKRKQSLY
jgi:dynein heavy chain